MTCCGVNLLESMESEAHPIFIVSTAENGRLYSHGWCCGPTIDISISVMSLLNWKFCMEFEAFEKIVD